MRCETVATGPSWERGYDLLLGGEKLKARRGTSDIGRQGNGIGLSNIIAGLITGINRRFGS